MLHFSRALSFQQLKKIKPHDELFMQLFIINVIITATLPQALSLTQPGNRNKLEHRKNKIFNQISLERVVLINDGLIFPTVYIYTGELETSSVTCICNRRLRLLRAGNVQKEKKQKKTLPTYICQKLCFHLRTNTSHFLNKQMRCRFEARTLNVPFCFSLCWSATSENNAVKSSERQFLTLSYSVYK